MTYQEFETKCWPDLKEKLVALEPLRKEERKAWIKGTIVGVIVFGIIVGGVWYFVPASFGDSLDTILGNSLIIALVVSAGVYAKLKPKDYRKIYKEKVIENLLTHTKYQWQHVLFKPVAKEKRVDIRKAFLASGLYSAGQNENGLSFDGDDVFYSTSHNILMAEVYALRRAHALRKMNSMRKNDQAVIFWGLFFRFDVSYKFRGETYISSEDREFLSKPQMGSTLTQRKKLRETDLEWNDFEKSISVQTTDEIEAREILAPDFMEILYDWWQSHKKATRLSFKDNHVYLGLPTSKVCFEPEAFSDPEKHKKTLWEILDAILLIERLFAQIEYKYRR